MANIPRIVIISLNVWSPHWPVFLVCAVLSKFQAQSICRCEFHSMFSLPPSAHTSRFTLLFFHLVRNMVHQFGISRSYTIILALGCCWYVWAGKNYCNYLLSLLTSAGVFWVKPTAVYCRIRKWHRCSGAFCPSAALHFPPLLLHCARAQLAFKKSSQLAVIWSRGAQSHGGINETEN